ncbi:interferon-induced, double-stranded RNA-activated protein kinase isoform X4 [Fundulus heteroclitus]|uniref:interferon-induced, double-stranded RNA-activated protein kinase isoform X4 n=1 Tax=Fundulus heteroclitus TaxID=8078 RepID=UPI00165A89ED|nr:interferon-induced, double-stranded RNA-activated protein kinase isoform X4 [Fundulus heteroclitus]XP_035981924.1 interferon-induced, double-stranded RNA-activated protein kinase isoform X4 [Fundulus heteroclitus]
MMDSIEAGNAISQLNNYAQKHRLSLRYEDVGCKGDDHNKEFTMRVVLDKKPYPCGSGKRKQDAKLIAAQNALKCLTGDQHQDTAESSAEAFSPTSQPAINYICWLNQYGQRNRVTVKPVETARPGPQNTTQFCKFIVGEKEYPEVSGKTKREAKEEAAKLVYDMLHADQSAEVGDSPVQQNQMLSKNLIDVSVNLNNLSLNSQDTSFQQTNYIGIINHYCQKTNSISTYIPVEKKGPAHAPQFSYRVKIGTKEFSVAEGNTTKEAKQRAAQLAWSELQEQSDFDSKVSVRSTTSEDEGASSSSQSAQSVHHIESAESSSQNMDTGDSIIFIDSSKPSDPKIDRPAVSGENASSPMSQESTEPSQSEATGSSDRAEGSSQPSTNQIDVEEHKCANASSPSVQSRFTSEFEILDYLGKGGFGCVYMVKEKLLGKDYAVKIVPRAQKALREVMVLSELQHDNIVRYYNCWVEDSKVQQERIQKKLKDERSEEYLFIKMELCNSATLRQWINEMNEKDLQHSQRGAESLPIAQQIVSGVEYIHSNNHIHRDLKPSNIMFGKDGKVKIGDFGLVTTDRSEEWTDRTQATGTLSYMAPEQKTKRYDRKVDIFSLGLIFIELLWKISSNHERSKTFEDARNQKFPEGFSHAFPLEYLMIKSLLCENPENRPEASQLKAVLEKLSQRQHLHLENHSV